MGEMELETTLSALAPGLLRFCHGATGSRETGEDVAQEAMAALVSRWHRAGPPENPAAFVFAIARRRAALTRFRRLLALPLEALRDGHSPAPGPADRAEGRQELRAALAAVGRLPRGEREALLLVAIGDRTLAEAATILGIGLSAAKMRVHRARLRLARELSWEAPNEL